jgi:hypothetical protein
LYASTTISYHEWRVVDPRTGHARLAGWPGNPLPLPLGPNGHEYAITEAGAIVAVTKREYWGDGPSPDPRPYHEAYLHLFALDLGNEEAITAFLNRFGPLNVEGSEKPLGFDWHAGFHAHVRDSLKEAGAPIVAELPYWDDLAGEDAHISSSKVSRSSVGRHGAFATSCALGAGITMGSPLESASGRAQCGSSQTT